ncbi:MAG TPA: Holliday junction branch migration protein RuvA [Symbiobacteriaceae bacterium]|nr:Holliday junction branch migration protein RuvA [Symbiobacteriaceae bacterium]
MIAHVRGELAAATADSAVVDAGGVGYRCLVPTSTRSRLPAVGQEVLLFTSLQVREDSMTLYGFLTAEEYDLFELLLKVEGIGPKVALSVLSATTPDSLRRALALEDITALCRVPGIGKKTAQRMVLELKDKVGAIGVAPIPLPGGVPAAPTVGGAPDARLDALEALAALGYTRSDAGQAVEKAAREAGEQPKTETLVRLALKHLYRG